MLIPPLSACGSESVKRLFCFVNLSHDKKKEENSLIAPSFRGERDTTRYSVVSKSPRVSFSLISPRYSLPSRPLLLPLFPPPALTDWRKWMSANRPQWPGEGRVQDHVSSAFWIGYIVVSRAAHPSLSPVLMWHQKDMPVWAFCWLQSLGFVFTLDRAECPSVVQINGVPRERLHGELLTS